MNDRYLLYIDLLGFADMTIREPRKVARLYSIIDSLNAQRQELFSTIVFSDTILVYNKNDAESDEDKSFLVWQLIEFSEDLHHRLTGQDIYFRGVLCYGYFEHYSLKNIQCFYGGALVDAYLAEKDIGCAGLFIDDHCNKFNKYFRTASYCNKFHFVYLNRHLEYLDKAAGGVYPCMLPGVSDISPYFPYQVKYLEDVFVLMRSHRSPKARAKLLASWDYHSARYPAMTDMLSRSGFSLSAITPNTDWSATVDAMNESIRYFKRLGAGTKHSVQISKNPRR